MRLFSSSASDASTSTMKKRVLIPISDGSEEIETTCIQDTLVRFGAEVVVASCKPHGELICTMSRGIKVRTMALLFHYLVHFVLLRYQETEIH